MPTDFGAGSIDLSSLTEDEIIGAAMVLHGLHVKAKDLEPGDRVIWRRPRTGGWVRSTVDSLNDTLRGTQIVVELDNASSMQVSVDYTGFIRVPRRPNPEPPLRCALEEQVQRGMYVEARFVMDPPVPCRVTLNGFGKRATADIIHEHRNGPTRWDTVHVVIADPEAGINVYVWVPADTVKWEPEAEGMARLQPWGEKAEVGR